MTVQLFVYAVITSLTKISTLEQKTSDVLSCDWLMAWVEHARSGLTRRESISHGLFLKQHCSDNNSEHAHPE